MSAPKIITRYDPPPIPLRSFDWCAWVEGSDEETRDCGWGETEEKAIRDLRLISEDFPRRCLTSVVKIGFARDVGERMRKLRVGCPAPIRLLGTLPGGIREERDIHCSLEKHRAHGEWFRRCPELDAILATIQPSDIGRSTILGPPPK